MYRHNLGSFTVVKTGPSTKMVMVGSPSYNNNNFIFTLDSEVKLLQVAFIGTIAIQCITKYGRKTGCKIKTFIHL